MAISGTVTAVDSRTVTTKFGVKPVYDVIVDGQKYSYGFKDPTKAGISVGASIEFDFTAGKYGKDMTAATVKVLSSGSGASAKTAPASAPAGGGGRSYDQGFPVPVTSDKISILRQNALTNAVKFVGDFPSHFAELSTNEQIEHIINVARQFADYTSGQADVRAVESITSKMEE